MAGVLHSEAKFTDLSIILNSGLRRLRNKQAGFFRGYASGGANLRKMTWYNWLVFLMPFLLPIGIALGLGFASSRGNDGVVYHNFLDVAHWFDPISFQYRYVVKSEVHRFKQRVDLHSTAAKIVQAINNLIFLACAVGYRIFRYIR